MNTPRIFVINVPRNSVVVLVFICNPMTINQFTGWSRFDSLPENAMNTGVGRLVHKVIHRVAHRLCELSFDPVGRWIGGGKGVFPGAGAKDPGQDKVSNNEGGAAAPEWMVNFEQGPKCAVVATRAQAVVAVRWFGP
jgi:hypothetical protein